MKVLLTGSRAYGTPREDSDIDIVMLGETDEDYNVFVGLKFMANPTIPTVEECKEQLYAGNLKFGRLNLILVNCPDTFDIWKQGTTLLKEFAPVTRDQAVYVLKGLREGTHTYEQAQEYLIPKIGVDL